MAKHSAKFIAHARLKDIVGQELINDDNVAIIELIKNSKDAGSNRVRVHFCSPEKGAPSLIVQDFGQGMSLDEIRFKWLNIAYSEKKLASKKKAYAGNKGIGRFSCDRLGEKLVLYTKASKDKLLRIEIDWKRFEVDEQKKQIGSVGLEIEEITATRLRKETGLAKFSRGTVLHIKPLRVDWTREKLERLKKELEKFVVSPKGTFSVRLICEAYKGEKNLNGVVENKIFENLNFRTTSIHSSISEDGETLDVILIHDGQQLFWMQEKNPYGNLKNVQLSIFYLNQPAKAFFNRRTGYRSVDFGSIFMFLNGFRVLPYGAESDDWLGLDSRRAQGQKRFLGTRELVGFIHANDRDSMFKAVSSREGLVCNNAFTELTSPKSTVEPKDGGKNIYGYFHKIFRKLEMFVVTGLDWDRIVKDEVDEEALLDGRKIEYDTENQQIKESLNSVITLRTPAKSILDLKINFKEVFELAEEKALSHMDFVEGLQEKFEGTSVANMNAAEKKNLAKFVERQSKKLEAKEKAAKELEKKLDRETKRRLFAEFESSSDVAQIIEMHHQTKLLAAYVHSEIDETLTEYRIDPDSFSAEALIKVLEGIFFEVDKIRKVADFASKASFNLKANRVREDVVLFLEEYIEKIQDVSGSWSLKVQFKNPSQHKLTRSFRPLELMMLVDNVFSNAGKAKAKHMLVSIQQKDGQTTIRFSDDGKGLSNDYKNSELFDKGITTTSGSGIGLYHVRRIVKELRGEVKIRNNSGKGAVVVLEFESK